MTAALSDPLWVITSFYNPAGYRRRLDNFHAFRRHLSAPLLVVELTPTGRGALRDDDADLLVRLSGEDRIWQKERLLNIAATLLPAHVRYVAWVDADLLFSDPDWPAQTRALLDAHGGLVQPFDAVCHLPQNIDPQTVTIARCAAAVPVRSGISIARSLRERQFDSIDPVIGQPPGPGIPVPKIYNAHGFAWAARRDDLLATGLFENDVIGGADSVATFAIVGRLEQFWAQRPVTEPHRRQHLDWSRKAHARGLFRHIADVPQTVYHLWHGAMVDRNYMGRHAILVRNGYDPDRDLIAEPGRPLRWTDPDSALARAVADYFFARREDGVDHALQQADHAQR